MPSRDFSRDCLPYAFLSSDRRALLNALFAEAKGPQAIFLEAGKGVLLAKKLDFDSAILGESCYRILFCLGRGEREEAKRACLEELLKREEVDFLYCRCPVEDHPLLRALLSVGFQLVTTELQFLWNKNSRAKLKSIPKPRGVSVRKGERKDLSELKKFAPYFSTNRFVLDSTIPRKRAQKVYSSWIENALFGKLGEDEVLAAERGGKIVGFATTSVSPFLSSISGKRVGTPGLIAVDEKMRGEGVNPYLMGQSLLSLLKRTEEALAPSHITNYPMLNSELKTYPKIVAADYIFQRHRKGREP